MPDIFHNPRALAPFYRDRIAITGKRPDGVRFAFPLPACVLDQGWDDPLAEGDAATMRRRYSIRVRTCDWPETFPPQTGDEITLADGTLLSTHSSSRAVGDYLLEAREK